jgi:hypothetical protein
MFPRTVRATFQRLASAFGIDVRRKDFRGFTRRGVRQPRSMGLRSRGVPLRLLCQTLGVARAGFDRRRQGEARPPRWQARCAETLTHRIRTILDREETFGYRRIWVWLRFKEGVVVSRKSVHRIMQRHGWRCRVWHCLAPCFRPGCLESSACFEMWERTPSCVSQLGRTTLLQCMV